MQIKKSKSKISFIKLCLTLLKLGRVPLLLIVVAFVSLYIGARLQKQHVWGKLQQRVKYDLNNIYAQIGMQSNSTIPKMVIDIKHKAIQKILDKRKEAIRRNVLITSDDDYVSAKISTGDKKVKVSLRLKGDGTDHIRNVHKMSFRIKVKGENTVYGMKKFSIHHPRARNYIYEWLYHEALRKEGILSVRYLFVNVILNGKNLGVYAIEEHFDKRLVEYGKGKEGPIIKFSENPYMTETRKNGIYPWRGYLRSRVDAFQKNKLLSNPVLVMNYKKAVTLLEAFRTGQLPARQVFDLDLLAKYYAISDLLGAFHGNCWNSERFYYNPITSKLEPVGFDGNAGDSTRKNFPIIAHTDIEYRKKYFVTMFNQSIFKETEFISKYVKELERVSKPDYIRNYLTSIDTQLKNYVKVLENEFPDFEYSEDILLENQQDILNTLQPIRALHAHFEKKESQHVIIEIGNRQQLPIEILGLWWEKGKALFKPKKETVIERRLLMEAPKYTKCSFIIPNDLAWDQSISKGLKIKYRFLGSQHEGMDQVYPIPRMVNRYIRDDFIRSSPNIHQFKCALIDEKSKKIFLKPGTWNIDQNMIIPSGYKLYSEGGVTLNFSNQAKFLSQSPLEFVGTEDSPIVINSLDKSSGGFFVMNVSERSHLNFVHFKNLSNPKQAGWEITGAVTFYQAPVTIQNSMFTSNQSEDSLNIVKSQFLLESSLFEKSFSDAFDSDFSNGEIRNCSFVDIGNDAMDFSGSVVVIHNTYVDKVQDKGISAGEASNVFVEGGSIKNSELAVTSKDMSQVEIRVLDISNSKVAFTVFQKKSEFGPATILGEEVTMNSVSEPYLIEEKCYLKLNGQIIKPDKRIKKKVKNMLYGNQYGKKS